MNFVCFFIVDAVIDVFGGVGIVGICGVVLLTVADPGFLDVYAVVDVATNGATVGTNQTTSKAAIRMINLAPPYLSCTCKCEECKAKHGGVINIVNALTADVKELISNSSIIRSKRISVSFTPSEIKANRRKKAISKALSSIRNKFGSDKEDKISTKLLDTTKADIDRLLIMSSQHFLLLENCSELSVALSIYAATQDLSAERLFALEKLKVNLPYFSLNLRRAKKDQEEYYKKATKKENSYKKVNIESLQELQRQFDELPRNLADFGARLRRVQLLSDENTALGAEGLTCGEVTSNVAPCINFLRNNGPLGICCNGIRRLANAAKTTQDRQFTCNCLKSAANAIPGINFSKAAVLPRTCGVNIPYKISPSTDCSKLTGSD
ncbi:Non-specific lipid-transfer protein 2 [Capsicum annuum]|nr:Non-specific lipid-transfer protein 2 [Capsicum annuum]